MNNATSSGITRLQVSVDGREWGDFDIGAGIRSGGMEAIAWDAGTDDEPCKQWVRAKFADGFTSTPTNVDFCEDLDDPIELPE